MDVERVSALDVSEEAVEALGLDATALDLMSAEAVAASIRRAASFLCPTSPRALARTVEEAVSALPGFTDESPEQIEGLVEALVSYGDLLELPMDESGIRRRQLFLAPPSYVRRRSSCLLLGVRSEGAPLLTDELESRVEYEGHVRLIRTDDGDTTASLLAAEGLNELPSAQWLDAPRRATPDDVLAFYVQRLQAAGPSGDIEGARVLDPASSVSYYRGRWRPLKVSDRGTFVARRPQAFGADLWCFAEVAGGAITKLIDLPVLSPLAPGSDEAWRLQAAIDVLNGTAQRGATRSAGRAQLTVLDLYSPIPSWAQRRLDIVGTPLPRSRGALFSYSLRDDEVGEEVEFLETMMWLSVDGS